MGVETKRIRKHECRDCKDGERDEVAAKRVGLNSYIQSGLKKKRG